MVLLLLSNLKAVDGSLHIWVSTEIWDRVVFLEVFLFSWKLPYTTVTLAWVRGQLNVIFHCSTKLSFSGFEGSFRGNHIAIKLRVVIVFGLLSNISPLEFAFWSSHNKFLTSDILSNVKTLLSGLNIWISSEVWNRIVHLKLLNSTMLLGNASKTSAWVIHGSLLSESISSWGIFSVLRSSMVDHTFVPGHFNVSG